MSARVRTVCFALLLTAHAALCERAFFESQPDIDPPPRELLRNGVFEDTFTFTLY